MFTGTCARIQRGESNCCAWKDGNWGLFAMFVRDDAIGEGFQVQQESACLFL
jgi:hypothetical protein